MNRTDAAAILNVDPSASPEEARRVYQELFTEHQVRLTNAPTPALRSLYQARLLELDEARDALLSPSFGDANSDLPTDQPSIPSSAGAAPPPRPLPPPPPRQPETRKSSAPPPPPPKRESAKTEEKATTTLPQKKSSLGKIGIAVLAVLLLGFAAKIVSNNFSSDDSQPPVPKVVSPDYADLLPPLRESITVGRVELGRGDYDAANKALGEADNHYGALPSAATSDTAVVTLKQQLDQLHSKVKLACNALRKVAERHPGEPTCKTL